MTGIELDKKPLLDRIIDIGVFAFFGAMVFIVISICVLMVLDIMDKVHLCM